MSDIRGISNGKEIIARFKEMIKNYEAHEEFLGPALVLADFGMARRVSGEPRRCLDALQGVHTS